MDFRIRAWTQKHLEEKSDTLIQFLNQWYCSFIFQIEMCKIKQHWYHLYTITEIAIYITENKSVLWKPEASSKWKYAHEIYILSYQYLVKHQNYKLFECPFEKLNFVYRVKSWYFSSLSMIFLEIIDWPINFNFITVYVRPWSGLPLFNYQRNWAKFTSSMKVK